MSRLKSAGGGVGKYEIGSGSSTTVAAQADLTRDTFLSSNRYSYNIHQ